jgi:sensor histidine kinase YesM
LIPAVAILVLNTSIGVLVHSSRIPLVVKEYLSVLLFVVFSFYLSMTHDLATVLLSSYMLPIFISSIFSNIKLTRRIFHVSIFAIFLTGLKVYLEGQLDRIILMEIFVACFMFLCSYLLAKVLMQYGQANLEALVKANEEAKNNEQAYLQAQIKPHFIYNAINTMVSFCYTDSEKAAKLLVNFSKYLRLIFDFNQKPGRISLEKEIQIITSYTEIEKARFGDLIQIQYDIDPSLLSIEIPSFCIQPFVENAIKHGLCKKENGGTIFISVKKKEEMLIIVVRDTGAGMSKETLGQLRTLENKNKGIGFSNISKRVKSYEHAEIDIQSTEDVGTIVTLNLPMDCF